jgi:cytochrome c556
MKRIIIMGALILGSLVSFSAVAQEMSEEEMQQKAVSDRQAVFKLLGVSMGPLGGMARGAEYDEEAALQSARRIAGLSGFIAELFATDTSGNSGLMTKAQNGIWGSQADFAALAADLTEGANQAVEILSNQGADGVRAAVGAIGQKCGACLDRFRLD